MKSNRTLFITSAILILPTALYPAAYPQQQLTYYMPQQSSYYGQPYTHQQPVYSYTHPTAYTYPYGQQLAHYAQPYTQQTVSYAYPQPAYGYGQQATYYIQRPHYYIAPPLGYPPLFIYVAHNSTVQNQQIQLLHALENPKNPDDQLKVKTLITSGVVNVNQPASDGNYPLAFAAYYNHEEGLQLLIKAGAKIDCPVNKTETPLFGAARHGNLANVSALIEARANINHTCKKTNGTPLATAIAHNHETIAQLLITSGAYVTNNIVAGTFVNQLNRITQNPELFTNAKSNYESMVQLLQMMHHHCLQQIKQRYLRKTMRNNNATLIPVTTGSSLSILPREIIEEHILTCCTPQTVAAFSLVSKGCEAAAFNERNKQMNKDENQKYENYEKTLLSKTQNIENNPGQYTPATKNYYHYIIALLRSTLNTK